MKPTIIGNAIRTVRYFGCKRSDICSSFADKLLNHARQSHAIPIARAVERTVVKIDSVRNCLIKNLSSEPTTLRMPTSFALLADLAVERFIKLMQASTNTTNAMTEKI